MAYCEDFPCCGHELGCCPDFDPDTGKQLNMKCTCGATVPLHSASSLCAGCLRRLAREEGGDDSDFGGMDYDDPPLDDDEGVGDEDEDDDLEDEDDARV
jgi:hypothetical protein